MLQKLEFTKMYRNACHYLAKDANLAFEVRLENCILLEWSKRRGYLRLPIRCTVEKTRSIQHASVNSTSNTDAHGTKQEKKHPTGPLHLKKKEIRTLTTSSWGAASSFACSIGQGGEPCSQSKSIGTWNPCLCGSSQGASLRRLPS